MCIRDSLQPEVDATEEVQGEIAEPIGDLPVYQSRSKKSKKKACLLYTSRCV